MAEDVTILMTFLKTAIKDGVIGVNILLYGPPGTGKTQLARMAARELEVRLYEVSIGDEDGEATDENTRFCAYLLCQRFLKRRSDCLVLFDEAEDVFPVTLHSFFGILQQSGKHKGWTSNLLENNPIPAIWISNSVEQIDPAFLRRFDLIVEVPVPPQTSRRHILKKIVSDLPVSKAWLDSLAKNGNIAPAHAEKAVKVARMANVREDQKLAERVMGRVIRNAQKAMGFPEKNIIPKNEWSDYDLRYLNADCHLTGVIRACKEGEPVNICLYGPPGSGKTKFVHFLAQKLEKSIVVKRASDILGSYVGQTEHNIASMFEEIHPEREILFLDEADSFLQDRARAYHSWEVTQVNELLVQMENFEGHFFCATNFLEVLDNAVFRRFALKIKFDYLRPDQNWELFKDCLAQGGSRISREREHVWKAQVESIQHLTPGDFANIKRQLQLMDGKMDPERFIEGLLKESSLKPGSSTKKAGF